MFAKKQPRKRLQVDVHVGSFNFVLVNIHVLPFLKLLAHLMIQDLRFFSKSSNLAAYMHKYMHVWIKSMNTLGVMQCKCLHLNFAQQTATHWLKLK